MEFLELSKSRRSIHHFTENEVTEEEIGYILEAARWAPSAGNAQPWSFIVVRDPENREKVWEATAGIPNVSPQNFIRKAPVHIIVCTDTTAYKGKQAKVFSDLFCIQDSAAATMNLLLAAADRKLGACWVGMFREEALRDFFNIPLHVKPVAIIPVGHTRSKENLRPRKVLSELVFEETWGIHASISPA
jgi:nitroreductase